MARSRNTTQHGRESRAAIVRAVFEVQSRAPRPNMPEEPITADDILGNPHVKKHFTNRVNLWAHRGTLLDTGVLRVNGSRRPAHYSLTPKGLALARMLESVRWQVPAEDAVPEGVDGKTLFRLLGHKALRTAEGRAA